MRITSDNWLATSPPPLRANAPSAAVDSYSPEPAEDLNGLQRMWRDYGVNPKAMLNRALVDRKPEGGTSLRGGSPGHPLVAQGLAQDMQGLLTDIKANGLEEAGLARFQANLARLAEGYGVHLRYDEGAPIVNWGVFPNLEVKTWGGPSACHEMVHALQCTLGGAMALGAAAAEKTGATTLEEIREAIRDLTPEERQAAYGRYVVPMETQAYAHFEQTAFEVGGMFGKKSREAVGYAERLETVGQAFLRGYETATVPDCQVGLDARFYGSVGHLARTHGETALLLGGGAVAYAALARTALEASPLLGAGTLVPLGYVVYRTLAG